MNKEGVDADAVDAGLDAGLDARRRASARRAAGALDPCDGANEATLFGMNDGGTGNRGREAMRADRKENR
jgi:hypothetical protein